MSYQVGIDLGATYCAAAVSVAGRAGLPEIVPLGPRSPFIPSVVFADPDGTLLVGELAEQRASTDPSRLARQFKRRIGDDTPLRIGGIAIAAEDLAARVVSHVLEIVTTRSGGEATRVAVTHPAGWGPHRLMSLRSALTRHGLSSVLLLSEPQAAAIAYASREPLEPGKAVAVYDLGGGGFTATVVRKVAADQFMLIGQPEELEFGGLDLDEVVFDHVRSALGPAWDALDPTDSGVLAAVARLRRSCIAAKEILSANTDVRIPVLLPGINTDVRLGRVEFEEMIRPAVSETVEALHRVLASAEISPDELAAVLLAGGSSRIPLVTQEVSAQLGRPVSAIMDPKGIIAMGAALAARGPEPAAVTLPVTAAEAAESADPLESAESAPRGDPAPPAWTRPPLPVGPPPSTRTGGRARQLVMSVAATVLVAFLVAGGVALANRNSSDGSGSGGNPTTEQTTQPATTSPTAEQPAVRNGDPPRQPAPRSTKPTSSTRSSTPVTSSTTAPPTTVRTTTTTTKPPSSTTAPTATTRTTTTSSAPEVTEPQTTGAETTPSPGSDTSGASAATDATTTRTP